MEEQNNTNLNNLSEEDLDALNAEDLESAFGSILQAGNAFLLAKGCSCSKPWDYC